MIAYIQHKDRDGQKLILQALVPFIVLKDTVLFTYRANVTEHNNDKQAQFDASMDYYQRRVDAKRSNEIKDFIRHSILQERNGLQLATLFPTSMILALSTDDNCDEYNSLSLGDDDACELDIKTNVFIVDGQHRMMGMIKLYNELNDRLIKTEEDEYVLSYLQSYKLNCTILVNYDLWEQGQVFINVNFKQKPVNKSLYYEIFGSVYSENQKDWVRNKIYLAHNMTIMLNSHPSSPFFQHIKMLGTGEGYVSQAFVVESLLRHFKVGGLWYFNPDDSSYMDTNYFGTELLSFFVAIKKLFPDYWPKESSTKGTIICKTTGFGAWIRLMSYIRSDDNTILLSSLKDSAANGVVCVKYVDYVCNLLKPLQKRAEKLFGEESEFKSSSGRGSEVKLFKRMLSLLSNPILDQDKPHKTDYDVNSIFEQIQDYLWLNPVSDLDKLGHHYDIEDIIDFKIVQHRIDGEKLEVESSFNIHVNIFLDNEDDSGFSMLFPSNCKAVFKKDKKGYDLIPETVNISVDTDKYYE